ncbi:related to IMP2 - mitochondrial inner membrane protease subunit [Cephalotrichum gorgonifer]|uniref:Mitochondrial inner membrane protease subunit 2 n=1 Tax=Cephalotrichum gorgonifer TaxID=2041049 RepID=A0AAE8MR09_9PEZI|nr:related to IMP2 - mitochondrial inner membrane protease subunit [Cephalotrichum gorgonifer]
MASAASRRGAFAWDFSRRLLNYATWVPVVICVNTFVAEVTSIRGGSMYPFLNSDKDSTLTRDVALNWKLHPDRGLARGMIVVFKSPLNPETTAVKRIIGVEGDLVWSRNPHEPEAIRVPPGHIWVEGDAGTDRESLDSNVYGPVSVRLVTGRLTHILYPWKKFGRIRWWEHPSRIEPRHLGSWAGRRREW